MWGLGGLYDDPEGGPLRRGTRPRHSRPDGVSTVFHALQCLVKMVLIFGQYKNASFHWLLENNVGYKISGHNIFVEDGIETNNVIRNNLIVSSRAVNNMLQTDTSVASIWVTHPTNHVYVVHRLLVN